MYYMAYTPSLASRYLLICYFYAMFNIPHPRHISHLAADIYLELMDEIHFEMDRTILHDTYYSLFTKPRWFISIHRPKKPECTHSITSPVQTLPGCSNSKLLVYIELDYRGSTTQWRHCRFLMFQHNNSITSQSITCIGMVLMSWTFCSLGLMTSAAPLNHCHQSSILMHVISQSMAT
jgi:hypothetical protein